MRTRDDRAEVGVGILRVAHDELAHEFGHPGHEIVVKIAGHDRAGGCRAVLPGVDQRPCHRAVDRGVEVSVVEHHERRLAAEFELGAMAVNSGGRHDFSAHRGGSGEGDDVDAPVAGQRCAGIGPGAGDDVEHPVGQAGLTGEAGQSERGQRGEFGGLDHHRAAGRQRRDDLPHRHLQRIVPRGDGGDHAHRFAPDGRGVIGGVLRGGLALEMAGRSGEERDVVNAARNVELGRQPHRLAGLADLLGDDIGGVGLDEFGELGQHGGPLGRRGAGPPGQRRPGRGHRHVHIGTGGQGKFGHGCAGCGVYHLMAASVGRHRCAVDPATGNHRPTVTEQAGVCCAFRLKIRAIVAFSSHSVG